MADDRPRRSWLRKSIKRGLVAVMLMAAATIGYLALPEDAQMRLVRPEAILPEDVAWSWAIIVDSEETYRWYLRHWPSDANAAKVAGRLDDAAWMQARRGDQHEDYLGYLGAFPKGAYVRLARSALEERLWQRVTAIGRDASYRAYLEDYPSGRHAQEAVEALKTKSR
jgi:hypothetical protein